MRIVDNLRLSLSMRNFLNGFTLPQMLAALAVAVLLLAVSIPRYRKALPNIKLQNRAQEMMDMLQEARQKTVTEQTVYLVHFDQVNNRYQLVKEEGWQIIEEIELDAEISIDQIIGLTNGEDAIFNFAGAVVDAGEVHLINTQGKVAKIKIRPSGFIRKE